MNSFKIIIEQESLEIGKYSIYGTLFIKIGEYFFPDKQWGDLVVGCLSMWLDNAISLCQSDRKYKEKFYFMDGPYYYIIEKINETKSLVSFYSYDKLSNQIIVETKNISYEILKTAEQLFCWICKKTGQEKSIYELEQKILLLKSFIN